MHLQRSNLSICLSVYLSIYLPIYLSTYLPIYLSTYLHLSLSLYLTLSIITLIRIQIISPSPMAILNKPLLSPRRCRRPRGALAVSAFFFALTESGTSFASPEACAQSSISPWRHGVEIMGSSVAVIW